MRVADVIICYVAVFPGSSLNHKSLLESLGRDLHAESYPLKKLFKQLFLSEAQAQNNRAVAFTCSFLCFNRKGMSVLVELCNVSCDTTKACDMQRCAIEPRIR